MATLLENIKLPSIHTIEINSYPLFTDSWKYKVTKGLNLFLGVNGLGKTTTANMIIYGIVGLWEGITEDYFSEKEHPSLKDFYKGKTPSVTVVFDVGSRRVSVERYLRKSSIRRYSIGKNKYAKETTRDIDAKYTADLSSLCSLDSIEDLSFLLRKLLIREEEGNYLLWDKIDQSRVIRLLLNAPGFYREFNDLEKEVTDADTGVRGQQDIQHKFRERQKHLILQRDEVIAKGDTIKTKDDLSNNIDKLSDEIAVVQNQKKKNLDDISYLSNQLKSADLLGHTLSAEIDSINDEIMGLEQTFFASVYYDPKVALASHKLNNYNICMFCNNKISQDRAMKISSLIEQNHACPVCTSKIKPIPTQTHKASKGVIERLQHLKELAHEKSFKNDEYISKRKDIEANLAELWRSQKQVDDDLNRMYLDNNDLKMKLSSFDVGNEAMTPYDRDIRGLQEHIDYYQKIIDQHKKKYDEQKLLLDDKNRQLNERINEYTEKLNRIFNKYASEYFKEGCVLVPYEGRKPSDSKVKLTTYFPQFDDILRLGLNSVSKSEGIFLEYLFRMALVELYYAETANKPFLIIETSEGAFDILRTDQLSKTIAHFGKNKFPFIAIVNISKPDFVKKLISSVKRQKGKLFNFMKYGLLDKEQEKYKKKFEKIIA